MWTKNVMKGDKQKNSAPAQKKDPYRAGLAYGRFIYRWRWLILGCWVVIIGCSIPFAVRLNTALNGGGYSLEGSESVQVSDKLIDQLHVPASSLLVVLQSSNVAVSNTQYQQQIAGLRQHLQQYQYTKTIVDDGTGKDGRTFYLQVNFSKDFNTMQRYVGDVRSIVNNQNVKGPAKVYLTGQLAIADELTTTSQQDAENADLKVLPIALIALLLVFGTVSAGVTPLLLALMAIVLAMAAAYPIALHTAVSNYAVTVISVIGLGISIDYSLFISRRFREELAGGRSVQDAVTWSVATAGEAILFSGCIVTIGFCGLFIIGIGITTSLGVGGALVVLAAVLVALTFLPALLGIMGQRINSLRVPWIWRYTAPHPDTEEDDSQRHGFWRSLALQVMKRPILVIVGVCAVLVAMGWPIFSLDIGTSNVGTLPQSSEARTGVTILTDQYPDYDQNPVYIAATVKNTSDILTPTNLAQIDDLSTWLAKQPHVTGVVSVMRPPAMAGYPTLTKQQLIDLYSTGMYKSIPALNQFVTSTTNGDLTLISVRSDTKIDSDAGKAQIDHIRANKSIEQGLNLQVGGVQATYVDFDRFLYSNFPKAILFIIIVTFLLLMLMFRSLLIPLKAVIMNVLSVSVSYGVLVFVFQWGHLSSLLNFTSNGFIDSLIPILLFCTLFGLSMDYEVFLLSRVREEWLLTYNNRQAVARGLEKTGSIITSAALLFVIVTVAFTFTRLIVTQQLGLGMTVAILVDATIIRSLLVPATMRLLGRWNWWLPGRSVPVEQPID